MSFEEFSVALLPAPQSPLYAKNDAESAARLVQEIRAEWPNFQNDDLEIARLYEPLPAGVFMLAAESEAGLIQLTVQSGNIKPDDIAIWLRFAYCNPRSVDAVFCSIVEWLMRTRRLCCQIYPDIAPERKQGLNGGQEISEPDSVCDILLPTIEYNRVFWQRDAGTVETAILRPGDAVARFITPQLTNQSNEWKTVQASESAVAA